VMIALLAASLVAADCSSPTTGTANGCSRYRAYGRMDGTTVTISSSFTAPEDKPLADSFATFERCTGVHVSTQADGYLEKDAVARVKSRNPPDLVIVPQPGLFDQLVATGRAKAAPAALRANLARFWGPGWAAYVTVDNTVYGTPIAANVKSLVWYSPKDFKDHGYAIPTTLAQLIALSNTVVARGGTPWCEGIASGYASGWPLTDWMEDMMLRLATPQEYDRWVSHAIPFNAPDPTAALNEVGAFLKNDAYVSGGAARILRTSAWEGGLPVRYGVCSMYRGASYFATNWPTGTTDSPNGDVFVFYLPARDASSRPVLIGGDFALAFSDRPEVQAVETYLSSDDWANSMASARKGDWISANKGLHTAGLTPVNAFAVKLLQDPRSVIRFDGSDQMPPAVLDVFYKQLVAWIGGQSTTVTLGHIDRAWPH
jgi:alpha-glucoside transport system substrate-binding protein